MCVNVVMCVFAGIHPMPFGPTYTASKHGVVAFTRAMKVRDIIDS